MGVIRGHVYRVRPGTWEFQVVDGDRVIFTDNTGAWAPMFAECLRLVRVARELPVRGYRLEYADRKSRRWYRAMSPRRTDLAAGGR